MVTRQTIERDLGMKWAQIKKLPGLPAMTSITVKGKKVEVPMPEPGDVLPVRLKGAPRGWRPRMDRLEGGLIYYETLQGHEQFVEAYRIKQYLDQTKGVEMKFPTAYSAQSEEEHFCESLALLSMNSLPDEYAIPFKAIWN